MQIPKQAKRVFKGVIFDVYQWPQKMFDGSFETFEMLKRKHSIQVLAVTKDKKILLLKERNPSMNTSIYSIIGGGQEGKETPLQTAKRELLEETGCVSKKWKFLNTESTSTKIEWPIYTYIALDVEKKYKQKLDVGEKIKVMEVNFEEFMTYATGKKFLSRTLTYYLLKLNYQNKLEEFKKKIFNK